MSCAACSLSESEITGGEVSLPAEANVAKAASNTRTNPPMHLMLLRLVLLRPVLRLERPVLMARLSKQASWLSGRCMDLRTATFPRLIEDPSGS